MTRFEREISGALGIFWKNSAENELKQIEKDLSEGRITIDAFGVARNRIGRILMDDLLEKLAYITDKVDVEATQAARANEVKKTMEGYRKNASSASAEDLDEMIAAFGKGQTVVNILTGQSYSF